MEIIDLLSFLVELMKLSALWYSVFNIFLRYDLRANSNITYPFFTPVYNAIIANTVSLSIPLDVFKFSANNSYGCPDSRT